MNYSRKPIVLVSLTLISISPIEAFVLNSRGSHGHAERLDWNEMWLSLADMASRRLLMLVPYSLAAPVFAFVWRHRIFTVPLHSIPMSRRGLYAISKRESRGLPMELEICAT